MNIADLQLSKDDRALLARILLENPEPPTKDELEAALADMQEKRFKRTMQRITQRIKTAEGKRQNEQVRMLLIAKKIVEVGYLMRRYGNAQDEKGRAEYWRGVEMLDGIESAVKGLKR